jgi:hypothetical protein
MTKALLPEDNKVSNGFGSRYSMMFIMHTAHVLNGDKS